MIATGGPPRHAGQAGYILWSKHWAAKGGMSAP
jgi:hypothetical protein